VGRKINGGSTRISGTIVNGTASVQAF